MYINPVTLSNQSNIAPGLLELTAEQEILYLQYNGFIRITSTDPVTIEPNIAAWEVWKATEAEKPPIPQTPTAEEQLRADIDYLAIMTGVEL